MFIGFMHSYQILINMRKVLGRYDTRAKWLHAWKGKKKNIFRAISWIST